MGRQLVSVGGRADTTDFRHELLGRLGLQASASDPGIEAAHNGLAAAKLHPKNADVHHTWAS